MNEKKTKQKNPDLVNSTKKVKENRKKMKYNRTKLKSYFGERCRGDKVSKVLL